MGTPPPGAQQGVDPTVKEELVDPQPLGVAPHDAEPIEMKKEETDDEEETDEEDESKPRSRKQTNRLSVGWERLSKAERVKKMKERTEKAAERKKAKKVSVLDKYTTAQRHEIRRRYDRYKCSIRGFPIKEEEWVERLEKVDSDTLKDL